MEYMGLRHLEAQTGEGKNTKRTLDSILDLYKLIGCSYDPEVNNNRRHRNIKICACFSSYPGNIHLPYRVVIRLYFV